MDVILAEGLSALAPSAVVLVIGAVLLVVATLRRTHVPLPGGLEVNGQPTGAISRWLLGISGLLLLVAGVSYMWMSDPKLGLRQNGELMAVHKPLIISRNAAGGPADGTLILDASGKVNALEIKRSYLGLGPNDEVIACWCVPEENLQQLQWVQRLYAEHRNGNPVLTVHVSLPAEYDKNQLVVDYHVLYKH